METPATLNPHAPLFIPSHQFHDQAIISIGAINFPAPIPTITHFAPPLPPPPSFPPQSLHHQYITHYPITIIPLPLKQAPPQLLPPPPPPEIPHFDHCYNDTSFQTPSVIQEQPQATTPPYQSPLVDSFAKLSITRDVSALNPITSGPRFRSKVVKFRGDGGRKKESRQEKGVRRNEGVHASSTFGCRNSRERKTTGIGKFVRARSCYRDIIPLGEKEGETTIMIKNIPSKYTREMLMEVLDKHCYKENERAQNLIVAGKEDVSAYDFLYLPIDFFSRLNKGYAFVNFINSNSVWKFYNAFNGQSWDCFNSPKRIHVVSAKIQGKESLVSHFKGSHFCCDTDEYLPVQINPPRDGFVAPVLLQPVGHRLPPAS